MRERIAKVFSREVSGLHEAAFLLGISSVASAFLGLVRDRLFAHQFGASAELDIYYAAFRIPDLLYVTVASFVSIAVIVPFLVRKFESNDMREVSRFLSQILTVFCVAMTLVCLVVGFSFPFFAPSIAPGFDAASLLKYIALARILLVSPLLLGISNILGGVTQSLRRFFVFALSPLLYNLGIITGILFFYPRFGLSGLGFGVLFGALLHLAIQIPTIVGAGVHPRFVGVIDWREIRQVLRLSIPRTLGLGTTAVVVDTILTSLATGMRSGSISVFTFAYNLQAVFLGIIGIAYSTAAFPVLARLVAKGDIEGFRIKMGEAVRHIIFWSLPIASIVIVLRLDIVSLFLGSGRFTASDVAVTSGNLAIFVIALVSQGLLLLFTRGYYALGQTRKPVVANIISMVLTACLAYLSVDLFAHSDLYRSALGYLLGTSLTPEQSVLALPVAFTLGMTINTVLHWSAFVKDFPEGSSELFSHLLRVLSAAFLGGCVLSLARSFEPLLVVLAPLGSALSSIFFGCLGILLEAAALFVFAREESETVVRLFQSRFRIAPVVADSQPEL